MTLKTINFFDGYDTSVTPNVAQIDVSALLKMETDNDYVINKGAEATGGDIYYNTTDNVIRYHDGTIWLTLIDSSPSKTKTISLPGIVSLITTLLLQPAMGTIPSTEI